MIKGIIERFEDELALIEIEKEIKVVPKSRIPKEAREGDVVVLVHNRWTIDEEATKQRQKDMDKLVNELWGKE